MAGLRPALAAVIAAGTFAAAAAARAEVALPGRHEKWFQVRAGQFLVCSNAGRAKTVEIAEQLVRFRAALAHVSSLSLRSPLPITVYAFKNRASFAPYRDLAIARRDANVHGVFIRAADGPLIVFHAGGRWATEHTVYHELVHSFLANSGRRAPLWYAEGLAEFYAAFADVRGQIRVGLPLGWRGFERKHRWQPLRDVLAADPTSPIYTDPERSIAFYAESWIMVHYLLADAPQRAGQLTSYLDQVTAGRPPEGAFASAFGATPEEFERELRAHMAGSILRVLAVSASVIGPVDVPAPVAMPRAEVLARLGYLLLRSSPRGLEPAEAFLVEALRADPRNVGALTGLAAVREAQGRSAEAERAYRAALDLEPDDPRPFLNAARAPLARLETPSARRPGDAALARSLLGRAAELCPADPDVWEALGHAWVLAPEGDPAPGIAALERCLTLAPDRFGAARDLVVLSVRAGRSERAREVNDRFLASCPDAEIVGRARAALLEGDLERAEALARDGDTVRALAALEGLVPSLRDPALLERARRLRDALRPQTR